MNIVALDDIHSRNLDNVPTTCIKLNRGLSQITSSSFARATMILGEVFLAVLFQ